ncbi:MAG: MBL fold metallo-hydrolase [Blastocatellia bacterium]|nr:MBL fold metallo-hydrolase [Blastocatellia bacterium]
MNCEVSEIAPDVYRLSTFHPEYGIQFNQFLIKDDEPFLMHTGFKKSFPVTLEGVRQVLDPQKLRWIGFSHFESDECGALNEWLHAAPHAQAVCSFIGAVVAVNDFADRPARPLNDDETFEIGRHRLRFLATPHVPHGWDAGLFFEEVDRTLFCSDLFFQPGQREPIIETGIVERARESILQGLQGPLAKDMPYTLDTERTLNRLADLAPRTLAIMHGSSYRGDGEKAIRELTEVIKEILGGASGAE